MKLDYSWSWSQLSTTVPYFSCFFHFSFPVFVVLFSCEFEHLARKQHICVDHDSTRIPRNQNPIGIYYIAIQIQDVTCKYICIVHNETPPETLNWYCVGNGKSHSLPVLVNILGWIIRNSKKKARKWGRTLRSLFLVSYLWFRTACQLHFQGSSNFWLMNAMHVLEERRHHSHCNRRLNQVNLIMYRRLYTMNVYVCGLTLWIS